MMVPGTRNMGKLVHADNEGYQSNPLSNMSSQEFIFQKENQAVKSMNNIPSNSKKLNNSIKKNYRSFFTQAKQTNRRADTVVAEVKVSSHTKTNHFQQAYFPDPSDRNPTNISITGYNHQTLYNDLFGAKNVET